MTARVGGRRFSSLVGAVLMLLGALLATTGGAEAHALLVRADPQVNAALLESPQLMNLFFSEPLQPDFSGAQVLDSTGARVDLGQVTFNPDDATNMVVRVRSLSPGVYTVVWNTLSQIDGHTWNGSYSFTVLHPDGSSPPGVAFTPTLDTPGPGAGPDAAVKWFTFAAVIAFVGGMLFARLAALPAARDLPGRGDRFAAVALRNGWRAAALSTLVLFATTTYDAIAGGLRLGGLEFTDEFLFDTRAGLWLVVRWSVLLAAAVVVIVARRRPQLRAAPAASGALLVLGAGLIASLSGISHGAALDRGGIWGTLFDSLHLAGVSLWVGMLGAMLWAFWATRGDGEAADRRAFRIGAVRRFSWAAAASVPVLATAGFLSTLIQVPAWRGFIDTDWGAAMLVKLAALGLLFAVAAANAVILRPRDERAAGGSVRLERRFTRLMRVELVIMLVVLGATAALTQLSSPRSTLPIDQGQKDNTITRTVRLDDLDASVRVSPNLVGVNRYRMELRPAAAGVEPDPIREVRLRFRYEDPAVGPVVVPAPAVDEGRVYEVEGAFFGLAGNWEVEVEVRRETRDDAVAGFSVDVEQPFLAVLPFGQNAPGALALPLTQFDWNGVGALWAALVAGVLVVFRAPLRDRVSKVAGDAAIAGATLGMAVAVVLTIGFETDPGRTVQNPVEGSQESISSGALVFAQNCAVCHGETGGGDGPAADTLPLPPANFRVHVPFHADGVLFTWITEGIRGTGMPAWEDALTEQQRWDVVNFLRANFDEPLRR